MKKYPASVAMEEVNIKAFRKNPAEGIGFLNACVELAFEENDPVLILSALSTVVKAIGVKQVAKDANLHRVSLHRMLTKRGNPEWRNVFQVFKALGIQPRFEFPKQTRSAAGRKGRTPASRRLRAQRKRQHVP